MIVLVSIVYSVLFLNTVSHTKLTNTIIGKHTEERFDVLYGVQYLYYFQSMLK
jgi:hypothetical protein